MAEQTFLQESGVTVTSSRFVVPAQTYAMSGVTSIKSLKQSPSRKGSLILIGLGIIFMLFGGKSIVGGLILAALGVLWWVLHKPKYAVVLSSASGEVEALSSKDAGFISRIVDALNKAIVARG